MLMLSLRITLPHIGGAIYVDAGDIMVEYKNTEQNEGAIPFILPHVHSCFLAGDKSRKGLFFINNTALFGGDILYGGDLDGAYTDESNEAQCISYFRAISSITPHENQLSLITSEPSRACHRCSSFRPDCYTLSKTLSIHPGQTASVPAVLVGQGLGTVAGSVFADFLDDVYHPSLAALQESQQVSQHQCNNLSYTIYTQQDDVEVVLVLTASKGKAPLISDETVSQAIEIYNRHHSEE